MFDNVDEQNHIQEDEEDEDDVRIDEFYYATVANIKYQRFIFRDRGSQTDPPSSASSLHCLRKYLVNHWRQSCPDPVFVFLL